MSLLRNQLLKTATTYIEAHNTTDVEALRAIYSPSCAHRSEPRRVHPLFPKVGFEEYMAVVADMFKMWRSFECRQFAEPVVDEAARTVVLFIDGKGVADVGTYENQYVVTLKMDQEGTLIEERLQFFDSQPILDWVARMGQLAEDMQEKVKNTSTANGSA